MTPKEIQLVRCIHNLVSAIGHLQDTLRPLQLELKTLSAANLAPPEPEEVQGVHYVRG